MRFKNRMQPTVISAYYPIPSKFKADVYIKWIIQFWPKTQCPLIFFTDPRLAPQFEEIFRGRGRTLVVGLPFPELAAFNKLSPCVWGDTHTLDSEREKHSPELYAIWYEKKEFVLRAIDMNPFGSDRFVWCDAGIGRFPEWLEQMKGFPIRDMIPCGKMLMLEIAPFIEEDSVPDRDGIRGNFGERVTVGGGVLASDTAGWRSWSKAYDAMLMRYYLAGRFIGKDQNIMGSMILEDPALVTIVKSPPVLNSIQKWFYLLLFLGGAHVV